MEIYHAYVSDSNGAIDNGDGDTASDSGGWELLDQPTPTSNLTPEEQPAEVKVILLNILRTISNQCIFFVLIR